MDHKEIREFITKNSKYVNPFQTIQVNTVKEFNSTSYANRVVQLM